MKNSSMQICDATIHPGEKVTLAMPLPERYSCAPMYMPIKVMNGKTAGPCVVAFSMLQGNEFNSMEIINRLADDIKPADLNGSLILVPALNVYGLVHHPNSMGDSSLSIVDSFPGSENGNFGERIANAFTHEVLAKADYCIELTTGSLNHDLLPQVYCNFDNAEAKALAQAFKAPVVIQVGDNSSALRRTTEDMNIPLLVYEAGEAMRFNEDAIRVGHNGLHNVMAKLEMTGNSYDDEQISVFSRDEDWFTAPASGVLHTDVELGQRIRNGEKIGRVTDPFSHDNLTQVKSTQDGVVVGINKTPLVYEGLSIFKLASFIDNEKAQSIIGDWEESNPVTSTGNESS